MILLLTALLANAAAAQAVPDSFVFRAGVSLVRVDTEAAAEDGRIIGNLRKEDFRVFDNGKEQTIVHFAAAEEPLDLILLFDISGSMKAVLEKVAGAAHEGLQALQPGDRVSVMVFNSHSRVVLPFTEDLGEVERGIKEEVLALRFGGGTFIQRAVDDGALRFLHERRTERRRAVLIITDNIGVRSRREQAVVRDFWEADAILSGLIIDNPVYKTLQTVGTIMGPQNLLLHAGMKGIAAKTGGDAVRASDPASAFQEVMRRIRTRYALYYKMPEAKPGTSRKIRVELSPEAARLHPNARLRARTGYVARDASSAPAVEQTAIPAK